MVFRLTLLAAALAVANQIRADEPAVPAPQNNPAELALQLLRSQPVAVGNSETAQQLRKWYEAGTAAGNVGDYYDNRDRGHSQLRMAPYPQLQQIEYTEAESATRKDWGAATRVRPEVVFGNSSTSAQVLTGGSNIRQLYSSPRGLAILHQQYTGSNLYIYPEHRDHDPGDYGPGVYGGEGYGDLLPTNTPYLIATQGSSGSDQPFMKALPYVLAALRPAVKKTLVEKNALMPTVQMILRRSAKNVASDEEYLAGPAHPAVFEGKNVDVAAAIKLAHSITAQTLPPVVQLKVTSESPALKPGIDYFDPATETLANLPELIARVWRGRQFERQLKVSAGGSFDLNDHKLTYQWVLLRGDPQRVSIKPSATGDSATIVVKYHGREPISPESALKSNRVEIGVFVSNGKFYSAPAFITFISLNNEARTYSNGQLTEIGYGASKAVLSVVSYRELLLAAAEKPAIRKLMGLNKQHVTLLKILANTLQAQEDKISLLQKAESESKAAQKMASAAHRELTQALAAARKQTPEIVDALEKREKLSAEKAETAARKAINASRLVRKEKATLEDFLKAPRKLPLGSIRDTFGKQLASLVADISPLEQDREAIGKVIAAATDRQQNRLKFITAQLARTGVAAHNQQATPAGVPVFTPLNKDSNKEKDAAGLQSLTSYERSMIEWYNAELIANVYMPGLVRAVFHENYADPRLTITKVWRDVYRYLENGDFDGVIRYYNGQVLRIGPQGVAFANDAAEHQPTAGWLIKYGLNRNERSRNGSPEMTFSPGAPVMISYNGQHDNTGKVVPATEPPEPAEK